MYSFRLHHLWATQYSLSYFKKTNRKARAPYQIWWKIFDWLQILVLPHFNPFLKVIHLRIAYRVHWKKLCTRDNAMDSMPLCKTHRIYQVRLVALSNFETVESSHQECYHHDQNCFIYYNYIYMCFPSFSDND